jgi:hypothetical protein
MPRGLAAHLGRRRRRRQQLPDCVARLGSRPASELQGTMMLNEMLDDTFHEMVGETLDETLVKRIAL